MQFKLIQNTKLVSLALYLIDEPVYNLNLDTTYSIEYEFIAFRPSQVPKNTFNSSYSTKARFLQNKRLIKS